MKHHFGQTIMWIILSCLPRPSSRIERGAHVLRAKQCKQWDFGERPNSLAWNAGISSSHHRVDRFNGTHDNMVRRVIEPATILRRSLWNGNTHSEFLFECSMAIFPLRFFHDPLLLLIEWHLLWLPLHPSGIHRSVWNSVRLPYQDREDQTECCQETSNCFW